MTDYIIQDWCSAKKKIFVYYRRRAVHEIVYLLISLFTKLAVIVYIRFVFSSLIR